MPNWENVFAGIASGLGAAGQGYFKYRDYQDATQQREDQRASQALSRLATMATLRNTHGVRTRAEIPAGDLQTAPGDEGGAQRPNPDKYSPMGTFGDTDYFIDRSQTPDARLDADKADERRFRSSEREAGERARMSEMSYRLLEQAGAQSAARADNARNTRDRDREREADRRMTAELIASIAANSRRDVADINADSRLGVADINGRNRTGRNANAPGSTQQMGTLNAMIDDGRQDIKLLQPRLERPKAIQGIHDDPKIPPTTEELSQERGFLSDSTAAAGRISGIQRDVTTAEDARKTLLSRALGMQFGPPASTPAAPVVSGDGMAAARTRAALGQRAPAPAAALPAPPALPASPGEHQPSEAGAPPQPDPGGDRKASMNKMVTDANAAAMASLQKGVPQAEVSARLARIVARIKELYPDVMP